MSNYVDAKITMFQKVELSENVIHEIASERLRKAYNIPSDTARIDKDGNLVDYDETKTAREGYTTPHFITIREATEDDKEYSSVLKKLTNYNRTKS